MKVTSYRDYSGDRDIFDMDFNGTLLLTKGPCIVDTHAHSRLRIRNATVHLIDSSADYAQKAKVTADLMKFIWG